MRLVLDSQRILFGSSNLFGPGHKVGRLEKSREEGP